jgi:RNA polymerase sigma-B factor
MIDEKTDQELLRTVQSEPVGSVAREAACEELVRRFRPLVGSCVQRYRDSPEAPEDLMQVGYIGLLKAINNFNPDLGESLAAYATPCIRGELKRHFRDKRWQVHVRRTAQELRLDMRKASTDLIQKLARMPTDAEVAQTLGISAQDLADAQRAEQAFLVNSLHAPLTDGVQTWTLEEQLSDVDTALDTSLAMDDVWRHVAELPDREQRMLMLRFYGNMTQSEIADQLGISQMHVSRLLAHALSFLRERLNDAGERMGPAA